MIIEIRLGYTGLYSKGTIVVAKVSDRSFQVLERGNSKLLVSSCSLVNYL